MQLKFFNVNYASGVQMFETQLRALYRAPDHMLAALIHDDDQAPERTAVISQLTWEWLRQCDPSHRFNEDITDAEKAAAHRYKHLHF
ncbi:hypothetical protein, partial [Halomonas sp.]|uniref:hypothetical protein n=1 Tax=Halomonas sp. TaxID=1486246 RepID=UPI0025B8C07F